MTMIVASLHLLRIVLKPLLRCVRISSGTGPSLCVSNGGNTGRVV